MTAITTFILVGLSLLVGQEAAATENQALRLPTDQWVVDWGETECTLARRSGDAFPITAFVRYELGREARHLIFTNTEWTESPLVSGGSVDIVLLPSGARISGRGYGRAELAGDRALIVNELDSSFLREFPGSTGLRVERRGRVLAQIMYGGSDRAFAALKDCNDDLLRDWGLDPVVLDSLSERPRPAPSSAGFRVADYPLSAQRRGAEGTTVVRLDITERGEVEQCTVVKSSSHADLDMRTCERMRQIRYRPALDASGSAVPIKIAQTVTWRLVP